MTRYVMGDGSVLHVCGPRPEHIKPTGRRRKKMWCFTERKRTLWTEFVINQPWYDPELFYRCEGGKHHSHTFPGF